MSKAPLGTLERTPLRKAWAHEAGEFTPWLAQANNLTLLAEALGLDELELVGTEHPVGDFKVDILCSVIQCRPDSPLEDEAQWPAYFAWLEAAALSMSGVFRPRVRELS